MSSNTLLLLQSVGQLGELGGHGHLVHVAVAHGHHPVDVVHQLGAVGVEGDVRRHASSHGQSRLKQ